MALGRIRICGRRLESILRRSRGRRPYLAINSLFLNSPLTRVTLPFSSNSVQRRRSSLVGLRIRPGDWLSSRKLARGGRRPARFGGACRPLRPRKSHSELALLLENKRLRYGLDSLEEERLRWRTVVLFGASALCRGLYSPSHLCCGSEKCLGEGKSFTSSLDCLLDPWCLICWICVRRQMVVDKSSGSSV